MSTVTAGFLLLAVPAFGGDFSALIPSDDSQARKAAPREEKSLKVGDVLKIPLPGNKSYSSTVEIEGDSVRTVSLDPLFSLTVQAAKPGLSTVRILEKFWRDPEVRTSYRTVKEVAITVAGRSSRHLIDPPPDAKDSGIPLPRLKGTMEWEGFISRQGTEMLTVVSDAKEWTALWKKAFDQPAPEVDFGKYSVACIFLGFHADWLYNIHIDESREDGNLLVVPYGLSQIILELSGPFRASGQYRMKAVPKKKGSGFVFERMENSERV